MKIAGFYYVRNRNALNEFSFAVAYNMQNFENSEVRMKVTFLKVKEKKINFAIKII